MLSKKVEKALNEQVAMEGSASNHYLAMACWCDREALSGCAQFLFDHAEEERMHMMKLIHYINDSGGFAVTPAIKQPQLEFEDVFDVFDTAYQNELKVSAAIDNLVEIADQEKDKQTYQFLQWYVDEQHEEEVTYRNLIDRIKLIGIEGRGLYFIDKEVETLAATKAANEGK